MRRREFLGVLGGAAIGWPLAAQAQGNRVKRIGVIGGDSGPVMRPAYSAFLEAIIDGSESADASVLNQATGVLSPTPAWGLGAGSNRDDYGERGRNISFPRYLYR